MYRLLLLLLLFEVDKYPVVEAFALSGGRREVCNLVIQMYGPTARSDLITNCIRDLPIDSVNNNNNNNSSTRVINLSVVDYACRGTVYR